MFYDRDVVPRLFRKLNLVSSDKDFALGTKRENVSENLGRTFYIRNFVTLATQKPEINVTFPMRTQLANFATLSLELRAIEEASAPLSIPKQLLTTFHNRDVEIDTLSKTFGWYIDGETYFSDLDNESAIENYAEFDFLGEDHSSLIADQISYESLLKQFKDLCSL